MAIVSLDVDADDTKAVKTGHDWNTFWKEVGMLSERGQAVEIPGGTKSSVRSYLSAVQRALGRPLGFRTVGTVCYVVHL